MYSLQANARAISSKPMVELAIIRCVLDGQEMATKQGKNITRTRMEITL